MDRNRSLTYPAAIGDAARKGWQNLLEEWDYANGAQVGLTDFGCYLDSTTQWACEVSGVVVTHNGGSLVQWLPNPFAARAINDPRLLQVGFPLDKIGAYRRDRLT